LDGLETDRYPGDVQDIDSLRPLVRGADLAFHLAGCISLESRNAARAIAVNVGGTANMAKACLDEGIGRLIHFSSIHAYDDAPGNGPIDEARKQMADPSRPRYGLSKAAGEREVLEAVDQGLDAVIVNPTGVLGPRDFKGSRMGKVLASLAYGRMPVVPVAGYDWVDARDVAEGAIAAATKGRKGQRYILSGTWASLKDLGVRLDTLQNTKRLHVEIPLWVSWAGVPFASLRALLTGCDAGLTPDSIRVLDAETHASSSLARSELGYTSRPLDKTLADVLAWQVNRKDPS
jgi:dihydroflavonol-4-reductase